MHIIIVQAFQHVLCFFSVESFQAVRNFSVYLLNYAISLLNLSQVYCNKSEVLITRPKSVLPSTQGFMRSVDGECHRWPVLIFCHSMSDQIHFLIHTFQTDIRHITKTDFFFLRNIAYLRPTLPTSPCETLIQASTSRIDHCNSLLCGLPSTHLKKLQYRYRYRKLY